jgi:AcrR family transcriptional regulator
VKQDSSRSSNVPRLRDRKREATTHEILAAAEMVVAEQGIETARIEEIARRAGVAVGTLYNYFADRDALMVALRSARKAELIAALDQAIAAGHGKPFRAQLEGFLHATLGFYEQHRQFFAVLVTADHSATHPPVSAIKDAHARAERITRIGVREGVLHAEYAEFYPALLFALMRGVALAAFQRKQTTALTELVGPIVHLFLHGASEKRS